MKILHLVSSGGMFGAERVILSLAGHQQGVTSIVGALENDHNPHLEVIDEAKKMNLATVVFSSKGRFDYRVIFSIKDFLLANNIDIVHTHNYKSDIVGFFAARLAKKKWIATNHVWHGTDTKLKIYEQIDAYLLKFSDQVIGVSQEITTGLLKAGINRNRAQTIHNGIAIEKFAKISSENSLKKTLGIKDGDIVISIIGRLSKEKGHTFF